ncbi:MAG TPA: signal peptidase II [Trebonia sp.]|nr:signal peptidase II [Trebonia sp.]
MSQPQGEDHQPEPDQSAEPDQVHGQDQVPGQGQAGGPAAAELDAAAEQDAAGPGAARQPGRKAALAAAVAVAALGLDIVSKALVVANLTPGEPVHVLGDLLEFNLLRNSGAAFSFGTSYTVVFTLLAMVVIGVVVRMARRLRSTGYAIAFGLLLAGATGNLGDRIFRAPGLFRGDVVDWIEVTRHFAVFNLADSSICIAAALFVLLSLLGIHVDGTRGDRAHAPAPGEESPDDTAPGDTATDDTAPDDTAPVGQAPADVAPADAER